MTRNNFISRGTLDSPLAWVELDAGAASKLKKTWKCAITLALVSHPAPKCRSQRAACRDGTSSDRASSIRQAAVAVDG